jgi:hypothetical protein
MAVFGAMTNESNPSCCTVKVYQTLLTSALLFHTPVNSICAPADNEAFSSL